jgi:hypothetical protein
VRALQQWPPHKNPSQRRDWGGGSPLVVALQLLATLASVQISYLVGCLLAAHLPARAKMLSDRKQMPYLDDLSTRAATR